MEMYRSPEELIFQRKVYTSFSSKNEKKKTEYELNRNAILRALALGTSVFCEEDVNTLCVHLENIAECMASAGCTVERSDIAEDIVNTWINTNTRVRESIFSLDARQNIKKTMIHDFINEIDTLQELKL